MEDLVDEEPGVRVLFELEKDKQAIIKMDWVGEPDSWHSVLGFAIEEHVVSALSKHRFGYGGLSAYHIASTLVESLDRSVKLLHRWCRHPGRSPSLNPMR